MIWQRLYFVGSLRKPKRGVDLAELADSISAPQYRLGCLVDIPTDFQSAPKELGDPLTLQEPMHPGPAGSSWRVWPYEVGFLQGSTVDLYNDLTRTSTQRSHSVVSEQKSSSATYLPHSRLCGSQERLLQ